MYGMIFTYNLVDMHLDFFKINIPIPVPWDPMGFVFIIFSVKKCLFLHLLLGPPTGLGWLEGFDPGLAGSNLLQGRKK